MLQRNHATRFLISVLVPALYLIYAATFGNDAGTRIVDRDATYYYLVNSYSIAMGRAAQYVAHPGLPLQGAGGLIAAVKHAVAPESTEPVEDELFDYHEQYLRCLSTFASLFVAASLAWAGWLAHRRLKSPAVIVTQAAFFLCPFVWRYVGLYQPEVVSIGIGSWLWIALMARRRRAAWLALLVGSAVATKLLYVSYAGTVLALRPRRRALYAAAGSALVFALWFTEIWPFRAIALEMMFDLAARSGDYTSGGYGMPSWATVLERLRMHFLENDLSLPSVALVTALLFSVSFLCPGQKRLKRFLAVTFLVLVGSFALYLRKPTHEYYVLPTFMVLPAFLAIYFQITRKAPLLSLLAGLLLLPIGLSWKQQNILFFQVEHVHQEYAGAGVAAEGAVRDNPGCSTLAGGVIPYGVSALAMGADWALDNSWRSFLNQKYPRYRELVGKGQIRAFTNDPTSMDLWFRYESPGCVVVLFSPDFYEFIPALTKKAKESRLLFESSSLRLYRLDFAGGQPPIPHVFGRPW